MNHFLENVNSETNRVCEKIKKKIDMIIQENQ